MKVSVWHVKFKNSEYAVLLLNSKLLNKSTVRFVLSIRLTNLSFPKSESEFV
jgi:hypothetical protein